MNHEIEFKGFGTVEPAGVRALIESRIARIEKHAQPFKPYPLFARVMVENNPAHKLYTISVTQEVPQKTLAAKKETHELKAGIREAFDDIERQLEDHKAAMRGEPEWKQLEKREEIRENRSRTASSELPDSFFAIVNPYLDRLRQFVKHAIGFLTARGDLPPDDVTADDIVDEALVEAYEQYTLNPAPGNIQAWLLRLATKQLAREVARHKSEINGAVSVEDENPETRVDESALADELLDFYHPDVDLRVEDILPNIQTPPPEQQFEIRECLSQALDSTPAEQRRLILLHYVQGLSTRRLAKMMGKTEPEVKRILEHARNHIREQLKDSGCTFGRLGEKDTRSDVEVTSGKLAG